MCGNDESKTVYYLCDTDNEYNDILQRATKRRKEIVDAFMEKTGGVCAHWPNMPTAEEEAFHNFRVFNEQEIKAPYKFQSGQGWYGKEFTGYGFCIIIGNLATGRTEYYIKPSTLSEIRNYKEEPNEWMIYCNS